MSARLNSDYLRLKDFRTRVESVLEEKLDPKSQSLPPDLVDEYFELQEKMEEEGWNKKLEFQVMALKDVVTEKLNNAEAELGQLGRRYPFRGRGDGAVPWPKEFLMELSAAYRELLFFNSLKADIDKKFCC